MDKFEQVAAVADHMSDASLNTARVMADMASIATNLARTARAASDSTSDITYHALANAARAQANVARELANTLDTQSILIRDLVGLADMVAAAAEVEHASLITAD